MKYTNKTLLCSLLAIGVAAGLSSCANIAQPKLDAKTSSVLDAMDQKLASAKTIRVTVSRKGSRGFYAGVPVAEEAEVTCVVQRPNRLVAVAKAPQGRRSIGYDGKTITFVDHAAGTHASVVAGATIDATVRSIQSTFGFVPPMSELLANQPRKMLLEGVQTGKHVGNEVVDGISCDHLAFVQSRMGWELWVGVADHLPKRIRLTYPNGEGGDPLTMTSTVSAWDLDATVTEADFRLAIPSGSREIDMIPLNK